MNVKKTYDYTAKILVVDDEPLIRKIISRYLSEKKYHIDTASNGKLAMFMLMEQVYDLVITDLRMPQVGGRELLQWMSKEFPDLPKIVLTGYGTNEDIILALKTGAYDFLTKPIVDFTILEHSISRAIERKRLNDEKNRYVQQLTQINEIISMLNQGKSTEELFNTLNKTLKKIIPFNRLSLATYNPDGNLITNKLVASDRKIIHGIDESFDVNEAFSLHEVFTKRDVLNINNLKTYTEKHKDAKSMISLHNEGMRSALILPLVVNEMTRGFLIFASINADSFKEDHISFLKSIVGQISLSIQRGELLYEIEQHTKNLENLVELRTREVVNTQKTTVYALSKLAETRDPETGDHLDRIRNYSVFLAQLLKYSGHKEITDQYLRDLYDSSILHDIGKVGIPDGILLKDGYLKEHEFEIMKKHTTIGYEALQSASEELGEDSFLKMAMDVTLYHHERWDGTGYPKRLTSEEIPLSARIVAIADVYDALTSKRPYKEVYNHQYSVDILLTQKDKFDPQLFNLFIENSEEFNNIRQMINGEST